MGCGCLIMGLLFVVGIGSFIYFISNMMKSSDPYRDSLAAAKQHPAVIESLGEPIKPGFFLTGSFNSSNDSGSADLEYSISGPARAAKPPSACSVKHPEESGPTKAAKSPFPTGTSRID